MAKIKDGLRAIDESLVLWRYLAQSGCDDKKAAIKKLHNEGKLARSGYKCSCPLCAVFFVSDLLSSQECPWRLVENKYGKATICTHGGSPYVEWDNIKPETPRKERQKAASAVYRHIKKAGRLYRQRKGVK